jgi:hypothetical protein
LIEPISPIVPIQPYTKPIEIPVVRVYEDSVREVVYVYNSKGVLENTRVTSVDLEA